MALGPIKSAGTKDVHCNFYTQEFPSIGTDTDTIDIMRVPAPHWPKTFRLEV